MSSQRKKETTPKPTKKSYASVADMIRGEGLPDEVRSTFSELQNETSLVQTLSALRIQSGLTQQQLAKKMGLTQGAISKIERGRNEDLSLGTVRDFVAALGEQIILKVGKPPTHVESVKFHALAMREHLMVLASMANRYDEMKNEIQSFFGEAFFNLLDIMATCQQEMPDDDEADVQMRVVQQSRTNSQEKTAHPTHMAV